MTPDQATLTLTATGLPSLKAEHPVTKSVIAAIPAEKADYRGQLSTYLRPMGAKVPSIYGESYDAREAREKAQSASR